WSEWRTARLRQRPPVTQTPAPTADAARRAREGAARRERARERSRSAARARLELARALTDVAALATDDAERRRLTALRERLWPRGGTIDVSRQEDSFVWLPEG